MIENSKEKSHCTHEYEKVLSTFVIKASTTQEGKYDNASKPPCNCPTLLSIFCNNTNNNVMSVAVTNALLFVRPCAR